MVIGFLCVNKSSPTFIKKDSCLCGIELMIQKKKKKAS